MTCMLVLKVLAHLLAGGPGLAKIDAGDDVSFEITPIPASTCDRFHEIVVIAFTAIISIIKHTRRHLSHLEPRVIIRHADSYRPSLRRRPIPKETGPRFCAYPPSTSPRSWVRRPPGEPQTFKSSVNGYVLISFSSSERQKAANSLNKRQDLLQALIKLHSPARSAWFPLQGRASKAARVDPESLKDGSDEMVIKFTDRQGVKREVGVQVISGEGTVQQRVKQMGERALKELGVVSAVFDSSIPGYVLTSSFLWAALSTSNRPLHPTIPLSSTHRRARHQLPSLRCLLTRSNAR